MPITSMFHRGGYWYAPLESESPRSMDSTEGGNRKPGKSDMLSGPPVPGGQTTPTCSVTFRAGGQTSASTATAMNRIVRYVVDQWNRRIGFSGSPRRDRRTSWTASTRNSVPVTVAAAP